MTNEDDSIQVEGTLDVPLGCYATDSQGWLMGCRDRGEISPKVGKVSK